MSERSDLTSKPSGQGETIHAGGDQVPLSQRWLWAVGGLAENYVSSTVLYLAFVIYSIGLGLSASAVGFVLMVPRIVDALIDPTIGNISDNIRTRWGRRRPFILIGGLLSAFFYFLTWMPPTSWGQNGLFAYFLVTTMLCFTSFAIFNIPYNALGMEMSTDYHERTKIQSAKYIFLIIAQLSMGSLYFLSIKFGKLFPVEGLKPEVAGVKYVALIVAALVIFSTALPAITCRERVQIKSHEKINFWAACKLTVSHKPFLTLAALYLSVQVGLAMINPISSYLGIYLACGGDKEYSSKISMFASLVHGSLGIVAAWPVMKLARRWGKRQALMTGQGLTILGALTAWFFYTPAHPWWQVIPWSIMATGLTCVWMLCPSMLSDVCDMDELTCGLKRAGMFGAIFALLTKFGMGISLYLSGKLLNLVGCNTEVAIQTPETLLKMRLLFMLVPAAFISLSMYLVWIFPITEQKVREMRAKIDARDRELQPVAERAESPV